MNWRLENSTYKIYNRERYLWRTRGSFKSTLSSEYLLNYHECMFAEESRSSKWRNSNIVVCFDCERVLQ